MTAQSQLPLKAVLAALIGWSAFQPLRGEAAPVVVSTLADGGPGSLRAAIAGANDGDVITFAIGGTITNLTGELLIAKNLDIVGPGPGNLAVSGHNSSRVFNIVGGVVVNLSGLTICDGHPRDGAAGTNSFTPGGPGEDGGGIYNSGTLALTNCVLTRCRSGQGGWGFSDTLLPPGGSGPSNGGNGGSGGGIYNAGTLTLAACALSSNTNGSGGSGGLSRLGIYVGGAGGSGGSGGGIYDAGAAVLIACTFGFNCAGAGGAGGAGGPGGSTQSDGGPGGSGGNGGSGGALYTLSSPALLSCTFAGNSAGSGGQGGAAGSGLIGSRLGPGGSGGTGGDGGAGGSGGGLCCLGSFQAGACTFSANAAGQGGAGGQGGRGGMGLSVPGGNGGNGGNGGYGGGGGGASNGGGSTLQNVLAAQNSAGAGRLGGAGGAAGSGSPPGTSGYPGSSGLDGSGPDLLGFFTSNGHNLIGLDDGNSGFTDGVLGDRVGSGTPLNPLLGPLADHGGPTFTCALLSGSPALDSGDDTLPDGPLNLTTDQRGLPRQSGAHVDIGAFEVQWASIPMRLAGCGRTTNGAIQMTLTNVPGASLTALATTNLSLPLSNWTVLGAVPEISPGHFQFIDAASTNLPRRFYRVRCP